MYVVIQTGDRISYSVRYKNKLILPFSNVWLSLSDGNVLGYNSRITSKKTASVDKRVTPNYGMAHHYRDRYNEVELQFEDRFSIIFRAYDNGVAYRFSTRLQGKINIVSEETTYTLPANTRGWMQKV